VTPVDLGLAAAGRAYAAVSRDGQASRGARLVIIGLVAVTAIWVLVISLTPTPMEISFVDLRDGHYQSRESWLRLEGELERSEVTSGDFVGYLLRDAGDPTLAVTVLAPSPLTTGHTQVTGQPLGGVRAPGTFEAFYAEVPTEPARQDPWLLIALPAIAGLGLGLGERVGYPVMRAESANRRPAATAAATPLALDETIAAQWNGSIGGEEVPKADSRACTVRVTGDSEVAVLSVTDSVGTRQVPIRRASRKVSGRACRIGGCRPGLEVHAAGSDIVFEFDSVEDRDRLAASLV
jgi:hypothetical protein